MITVTHSLAHRATSATRHKRWQPYQPLQTSKSPNPLPPTPPYSAPHSPTPTHISESDLPTTSPPMRDAQKSKYVLGLVDQAVKSLCNIWNYQDIPSVFLSSKANVSLPEPSQRGRQLPSSLNAISPPSTLPTASSQVDSQQDTSDAKSSLIPLRSFVHEVLRRSRTSGAVLQTALCYLEAIRSKVPELVRQENCGQGIRGEVAPTIQITAGESELDCGLTLEALLKSGNSLRGIPMDFDKQGQQDIVKKPNRPAPTTPLPPLPPLPSPLLCPRRTFLASLILASKFTQDRCYSNRAWAKLSGLPAREIGRCERALGDALQWRLWVGKKKNMNASTAPNGTRKPVSRSRSESDVMNEDPSLLEFTSDRSLKRHATLSSSFMAPSVPPPLVPIPVIVCSPAQGRDPVISPPTPTLTYSPSSSEDSEGERTIHMSGFMDANHFSVEKHSTVDDTSLPQIQAMALTSLPKSFQSVGHPTHAMAAIFSEPLTEVHAVYP